MKNSRHIFLQLVALLLVCGPVNCLAVDMLFQPGVTYDWWEDNHNISASQLTFPLQFTVTRDDLSFRLLGGYTRTSLSDGAQDISMSNLLDTKIGASYRIADRLPFELLLGLDLNLPTGKTNLSRSETRLVMDPDLLPINTYGEGFNVNPTVTVAKGWRNWTFALGLGYLWRGEYDFSETLQNYQPGMAFNALAEARYYYQPKSFVRLFSGYTIYNTDTADGRDIFDEGDVLLVGGSFSHALNPGFKFSGGLSGTFRGDATVYDKVSGIQQNLNAFNGTETVLDLGASYAVNSKTLLTVPFQARLIEGNDNPSAFHAGARQKYSLGIGAAREITPVLSADLSLKGFYKHDAATEIPEITAERYIAGIGIAVSLTGKF
jgi:hypothetical protein